METKLVQSFGRCVRFARPVLFFILQKISSIIDLPEIIVAMMPCLFFDIHLLLTTIYSFSFLFLIGNVR